MTAWIRSRDALGRERWEEHVIDTMLPRVRPEVVVEDDFEELRRRP